VLSERASTKGGALTLKTALPARNAGFIMRPRRWSTRTRARRE